MTTFRIHPDFSCRILLSAVGFCPSTSSSTVEHQIRARFQRWFEPGDRLLNLASADLCELLYSVWPEIPWCPSNLPKSRCFSGQNGTHFPQPPHVMTVGSRAQGGSSDLTGCRPKAWEEWFPNHHESSRC